MTKARPRIRFAPKASMMLMLVTGLLLTTANASAPEAGLFHPLVQVRVDTLVELRTAGRVSAEGLAAIRAMVEDDPSERVRDEAARTLAALDPRGRLDRVLDDLNASDSETRRLALLSFSGMGPESVGPYVARLNELVDLGCPRADGCYVDFGDAFATLADFLEVEMASQGEDWSSSSLRDAFSGDALRGIAHLMATGQDAAVAKAGRRLFEIGLSTASPDLPELILWSIETCIEMHWERCPNRDISILTGVVWPPEEEARALSPNLWAGYESYSHYTSALGERVAALYADPRDGARRLVGPGEGYVWASVVSAMSNGAPTGRAIVDVVSGWRRYDTRGFVSRPTSLTRMLPSADTAWIVAMAEQHFRGIETSLPVGVLYEYLDFQVSSYGSEEAFFALTNLLDVDVGPVAFHLRRLAADPTLAPLFESAASALTFAVEREGRSIRLIEVASMFPVGTTCTVLQNHVRAQVWRTVEGSDNRRAIENALQRGVESACGAAHEPLVALVSVAVGRDFAVALDEAAGVWTWKGSRYGDTPTIVSVLNGVVFTTVTAGGDHSLALDQDGNAWAWGTNQFGQLGRGDRGGSADTPTRVIMPAGVSFTAIAAGYRFSLALDQDGNAWAWGLNDRAQLGIGSTGGLYSSANDRHEPAQVIMPTGVSFTTITAGERHSLALDQDGNAWAWGAGGAGQLGNESTGNPGTPAAVNMPPNASFTAITAGSGSSLALDEAGDAWAWGANDRGQLGIGSASNMPLPTRVLMPGGVPYAVIDARSEGVLALDVNGDVWAWGSSLGRGREPTRVSMPDGVAFTAIAVGERHGVALDRNGTAWAWRGYDADPEIVAIPAAN